MSALTINPDSAFAIIQIARQYAVKASQIVADCGSNPTNSHRTESLEFGPFDTTRRELVSAVRDLNDDDQQDLVALVMLGRGDFTLAEWSDARKAALDISRACTPDFIAGISNVSDYLEEGMSYFDDW